MSASEHPLPSPVKRINLALQGGGAHGAFTWGVLDALLEDGRIDVEAVGGASAGAVNAVALAYGLAAANEQRLDRAEAMHMARKALRAVWRGVMAAGSLSAMKENFFNMVPFLSMVPSPSDLLGRAMQSWSSPYNLNPLDINPLRSLLKREIDFDIIARAQSPRVYVSATHVKSGRAEIFTGNRLTVQAVMASSCLPQVFQAVEIDGEHYWDGGFVSNPPISPLIRDSQSRDILLVQINPLVRGSVPLSQSDIADRMTEINFNASLRLQMQTVDVINNLLDKGVLTEPEFKRIYMHRVDGGDRLAEMGAFSKLSTDASTIEQLFELGRELGAQWLSSDFCHVGQRSSINIREDYADETVLHNR